MAQSPDIGAIGRTDQVRQHVHLAERIADDGTRRGRMGQSGPIRAGNVAAPHGIVPLRTDSVLGGGLGELIDCDAMAFVERLVQQLGCLVVTPGEANRGTVQVVVGALWRRNPELLQDLTQFGRGEAGSDDGAMQIGVEFPNLRATRRSGR